MDKKFVASMDGQSAGVRTHRKSTVFNKDASKATIDKLSKLRKGEFLKAETDRQSKNNADGKVAPIGVTKNAQRQFETILKKATVSTSSVSSSSGSVERMVPEIYSPLFQVANLNLPRDRMTMNAWNRSFFDTNPIVRNGITLHSTYPISKINIKCKDRGVQRFFEDMTEKIDLFEVIAGVAFEYWKLGEVFPYAEFDENKGAWSSIVIQNPDFIQVNRSPVSTVPLIYLRPDPKMQGIVNSSKPEDIKLLQQFPDYMIHHIRRNEPIPLDNFNVSHLKLGSSPYDVRGISLIVSCYKMLMLWDKLFECYSEDTEILTDKGFKKYTDVIIQNNDGSVTPNKDYKIACYDLQTEAIEYHFATNAVIRQHNGDMMHFKSKNIDLCITPGHEMLIHNANEGWHKTKAETLIGKRLKGYKVRNVGNWNGESVEGFDVLGKKIPSELYLKFLGYLLTEGSISKRNYISFTQATTSDCFDDLRKTVIEFFEYFDRKICETVRQPKQRSFKKKPEMSWQGAIGFKEMCAYFKEIIGTNGQCSSKFKRIPRFILNLDVPSLKTLLDTMTLGDGTEYNRKHCKSYKYATSSKQLASDFQEIVFKCGFYSSLNEYNDKGTVRYMVYWSDSDFGKTPELYNSRTGKSHLTVEPYNDKVWCVTVPTGIVVIRRRGKVAIQGQCKLAQADSLINPLTLITVGGNNEGEYHPTQNDLENWRTIFEDAQYDKDFKIISHAGVKVERVGASGQIVDTQNDFTFIKENILAGLMIPKAIIDQEGPTYASASVGLEVLRTRYVIFRNMIEKWLEKKIFAPISEVQEFFEYKDGEKVLIVPEVDWNHMNLYDLGEYVNAVNNHMATKKISFHTLYRSLGLNWEEEQRYIREENIQEVIAAKETAQLQEMDLAELRAINPDEPIQEKTSSSDQPLPGVAPPGGGIGGMGMPDLGVGGGGLEGLLGGGGGGMEPPGSGGPPGGAPPTPPPA